MLAVLSSEIELVRQLLDHPDIDIDADTPVSNFFQHVFS